MQLSEQVKDFFSAQGPIAQHTPSYEVRPGQLAMAEAVAEAIECEKVCLIEAGTGTGKTYAYLVPALLSGKRIIVSTATKALQHQLVDLDLPALQKWLARPFTWMQLKGRENYVCEQRLRWAELDHTLPKVQQHQLALIRSWLSQGGSGDKGACEAVEESESVWGRICSKAEVCQQGCEASCIYPELKEMAQSVQVLVVNHHLLSADFALKEKGLPGVLPEAEVYIVDEAHQLPDIVQQFLGLQIGSAAFKSLCDEVEAAQQEVPDQAELSVLARKVKAQVEALSQGLGQTGRMPKAALHAAAEPLFEQLLSALHGLHEVLETAQVRSKQLQGLYQQLEGLIKDLRNWLAHESPYEVAWLEAQAHWFRCYITPLRVDQVFGDWVARYGKSWLFTSATLQGVQGFTHFQQRLGLQGAETLTVESPFDYAAQGLIYHPPGLPNPQDSGYVRQCLRRLWPLLQASQGHALLLFSSYRAMHEAYEILQPHWQGTLLMQGEQNKPQLLKAFKTAHRPVLLATASFWEGVDLPGDLLRLVMIDKIPFAAPDDPVLQAQEAYLKQQGKSAFALIQLPVATLALKQGVGRLIRTTSDKGVLMLCDPRLTQKNYGQLILQQLPPFSWTHRDEDALAFLSQSVVSTP